MNPGVQAITELARIGYQVGVEGQKIVMRYYGLGLPDPGLAKRLRETVAQHKQEVLKHLSTLVRCQDCRWAWWEGGKIADCLDRPWDYELGQWAEVPHPCSRFTPRPTCPTCGGALLGPYLNGKIRCMACDWMYLAGFYPFAGQKQ